MCLDKEYMNEIEEIVNAIWISPGKQQVNPPTLAIPYGETVS
jgi:hypothetical protein